MTEQQMTLPGMEECEDPFNYREVPAIGSEWGAVADWIDELVVGWEDDTPVDLIFDILKCGGDEVNTEITKKFIRHALWCIKVFNQKQQNYGPNNIAQLGEQGIISRVKNDKFSRLEILREHPERCLDGEPMLDSWHDSAVYGILGAMVHVGDWPTIEDLGIENVDIMADLDTILSDHAEGKINAHDALSFLEERLRKAIGK